MIFRSGGRGVPPIPLRKNFAKKQAFLDCVAFATRAFATPIFVASATPIFVASATPYFRTFATRTAATPKFFLIFHLFKCFKMTNFSLEVVMDEVLDM